MRIDYDLVRTMFIDIEAFTDGSTNFPDSDVLSRVHVENKSKAAYHLKFLRDAGLIEGPKGLVIDITPRGRAYLDNVRDDEIWARVKNKIRPYGTVAMPVISDLASSLIRKSLGL